MSFQIRANHLYSVPTHLGDKETTPILIAINVGTRTSNKSMEYMSVEMTSPGQIAQFDHYPLQTH